DLFLRNNQIRYQRTARLISSRLNRNQSGFRANSNSSHGKKEIVRINVRYSAHTFSSSNPTPSVNATPEYPNVATLICRNRCASIRSILFSSSETNLLSGSTRNFNARRI